MTAQSTKNSMQAVFELSNLPASETDPVHYSSVMENATLLSALEPAGPSSGSVISPELAAFISQTIQAALAAEWASSLLTATMFQNPSPPAGAIGGIPILGISPSSVPLPAANDHSYGAKVSALGFDGQIWRRFSILQHCRTTIWSPPFGNEMAGQLLCRLCPSFQPPSAPCSFNLFCCRHGGIDLVRQTYFSQISCIILMTLSRLVCQQQISVHWTCKLRCLCAKIWAFHFIQASLLGHLLDWWCWVFNWIRWISVLTFQMISWWPWKT